MRLNPLTVVLTFAGQALGDFSADETRSEMMGTLVERASKPEVSGYNYVGCFSDQENPRPLGVGYTHENMTLEICEAYCSTYNGGQPYFGLEYYRECYCDCAIQTNLGPVSDPDNTMCNLPCDGDATETCGGDGYMSVYMTANFSTCPPTSNVTANANSNQCEKVTGNGTIQIYPYNGQYFNMTCGLDARGLDINHTTVGDAPITDGSTSVSVVDFETCMQACTLVEGCISCQWVPQWQQCFYKSTYTENNVPSYEVDTGLMLPLYFLGGPSSVNVGETSTYSYHANIPTDPVTIVLLGGPSSDLQTIYTITTVSMSTFTWTIPSTLTNATDYVLEIMDSTTSNYGSPFTIQGDAPAPAVASATTSSASAGPTVSPPKYVSITTSSTSDSVPAYIPSSYGSANYGSSDYGSSTSTSDSFSTTSSSSTGVSSISPTVSSTSSTSTIVSSSSSTSASATTSDSQSSSTSTDGLTSSASASTSTSSSAGSESASVSSSSSSQSSSSPSSSSGSSSESITTQPPSTSSSSGMSSANSMSQSSSSSGTGSFSSSSTAATNIISYSSTTPSSASSQSPGLTTNPNTLAKAPLTIERYGYLGCYTALINQIPLLNTSMHNGNPTDPTTLEACTHACSIANCAIAGMLGGEQCWCGRALSTGSPPNGRVAESACNLPCAGNVTEACGGVSTSSSSTIPYGNAYSDNPSDCFYNLTTGYGVPCTPYYYITPGSSSSSSSGSMTGAMPSTSSSSMTGTMLSTSSSSYSLYASSMPSSTYGPGSPASYSPAMGGSSGSGLGTSDNGGFLTVEPNGQTCRVRNTVIVTTETIVLTQATATVEPMAMTSGTETTSATQIGIAVPSYNSAQYSLPPSAQYNQQAPSGYSAIH